MEKADLLGVLRANGITNEAVLSAISTVPREEFVREQDRRWAWEDTPLPIGSGQTISQPFVVALMTESLDITPGESVLDVGTGCGYQAAILAAMGARVHSIEIRPDLARSAARRLARLGFHSVEVVCGDGRAGLPEAAPFDAILVAAATRTIPEPLLNQLRVPGAGARNARLILPLESGWQASQRLVQIERAIDGFQRYEGISVRFVPLLGG